MRRCLVVALCVAVVASLPVASLSTAGPAAQARAATAPLPTNAKLFVPGHGWGHARGMGQYGAKGMAQSGKAWTDIVTHFYSGVTQGKRNGEDIRVLVATGPSVTVTADRPFTVSWSDGAAIATSDDANPYLRARYTGSKYAVERSASWKGPWAAVASGSKYVVFTRGSSVLQLVANSKGGTRYFRGSLIARYSSNDGMRAINELRLEEYLYGVVPHESPASWPAEALKSQSVAARTYSVYKKDAARSKGNSYDICSTTSCQVYYGYARKESASSSRIALEYSSSNSAVDATAGRVLLYGGKPILAEYSSSTGGYTAPSSVAYMKAVPDAGDTVSPYHDWDGVVTVADVVAKWPEIGGLTGVDVTKRNGYGEWGGRVNEMKLVGTKGEVTLSGGDWRSAFSGAGVRSNWFDVKYWAGQVVSVPASVSIRAGDTKTFRARIKNTGTAAWPIGGEVRLAAAGVEDFSGPGWVSPTRAAAVTRNVSRSKADDVRQGETAEFDVPLNASSVQPGTYTERFRAIADGYSTMNPVFYVSIEVLSGWIEAAPNLLTNSSFERGLTGWAAAGTNRADRVVTDVRRDGEASLALTGGGSKSMSQTVAFASGKARRFALGGWSRTTGSSSDGGAVGLTAVATYADGATSRWDLAFSRAPHVWTYGERELLTSGTRELASMTVSAVFQDQTGTGHFDAIRLIESVVRNPSFEVGLASWGTQGLAGADGVTDAEFQDGVRALALSGSPESKSVYQKVRIAGPRYMRYVVQAWTKNVGTDAAGGPIRMNLSFVNTDGSRTAVVLPLDSAEHDWAQVETMVRADKPFSDAVVYLSVAGQTGKVYFDDVRVVESWSRNPFFERGLDSWTGRDLADGDGPVSTLFRDGGRSLRLSGGSRRGVVQGVPVAGSARRRFVVSAWSRSAGTSSQGFVGLIIAFRNRDGSTGWQRIPFAREPHDWTFVEKTVTAPNSFKRIDIYGAFYDQTGYTNFDGIRLRSA
ncbi:MAG: SpoIID/LytB domain-containing protein [Actinomycetota bacterium]